MQGEKQDFRNHKTSREVYAYMDGDSEMLLKAGLELRFFLSKVNNGKSFLLKKLVMLQ